MEAATLRRVVLLVAILNLAYFGIEFSVALKIGSVSLFADSIDFLEDTSINLLIARALRWSATNRARVGLALAGIILVPSAAALWQTWQRFLALVPPAALPLSLVGGGALLVNLSCIVTGEIPRAQRQSHARRVSLRAKRSRRECRDYRPDFSLPTPGRAGPT